MGRLSGSGEHMGTPIKYILFGMVCCLLGAACLLLMAIGVPYATELGIAISLVACGFILAAIIALVRG